MAGNQIRTELDAIMVKREASYGVDPVPTEGLELRGSPTTSADRVIVERARMWGSSGRVAHGVVEDKVSFNFQCAVSGVENIASGVPGVDPILFGSGFEPALSGDPGTNDVQAQYTIESTGHGSYAMYRLIFDSTTGNAIRIKLLGCRSNVTFTIAMNGELIMDVAGQALYAAWEASAALTKPSSFNFGVKSFICQDLTTTFAATARRFTNLSFGTLWNVSPENSLSGTSNADEILLSGARPNLITGSFNPVMLSTDFAASGFADQHRDATEGALSLSFTNGDYSFTVSAPQTQLDPNFSMADDGAHKRFNTPFYCNDSDAGDDALVLTFDAA